MKVNSNKAQSMQDVLKKLEDGVQAVFTSENYISFLKMMAQFHNYSYNNVILILTQCPTATRCASFQTWKKLGHPVKRGEKGIKVLVPIPYTYEKKQKTVDEDGNAIMETVDAKGLTFRIGHVFDAQQVDGQLPSPCHELTDDSEELQAVVNRIINENDDISYDVTLQEGGANGYYRVDTKQICLRTGMAASQQFKTLAHERKHSILHCEEAVEKCKYTASEREVQAESVAFVVCNAFGVDSGTEYSFPYIATWQGKDMNVLRSSLSVIEKTARELISWFASYGLTLEAAV